MWQKAIEAYAQHNSLLTAEFFFPSINVVGYAPSFIDFYALKKKQLQNRMKAGKIGSTRLWSWEPSAGQGKRKMFF